MSASGWNSALDCIYVQFSGDSAVSNADAKRRVVALQRRAGGRQRDAVQVEDHGHAEIDDDAARIGDAAEGARALGVVVGRLRRQCRRGGLQAEAVAVGLGSAHGTECRPRRPSIGSAVCAVFSAVAGI